MPGRMLWGAGLPNQVWPVRMLTVSIVVCSPVTRMIAETPMGDEHQPKSLHIGQRLLEVASRNPDHIALVEGSSDPATRRRWTYRDVAHEATLAAHALLTQLNVGDRIAVWAPGVPEWTLLQYGAALAGLVVVPINPSSPSVEVEHSLRQAQCTALFVVSDFRGYDILGMAKEISSILDLKAVVDFADWRSFLESGDPDMAPPGSDSSVPAILLTRRVRLVRRKVRCYATVES